MPRIAKNPKLKSSMPVDVKVESKSSTKSAVPDEDCFDAPERLPASFIVAMSGIGRSFDGDFSRYE